MSIGLDAIQSSKSFHEFRGGAFASVPPVPGVYVVFAPAGSHAFAATRCGGKHKGRDPVVDLGILETKWVEGASLIYIGKANDLRRRLREYAAFGSGRPAGHYGGRYIWQLEGCQDLMVGSKCGSGRSSSPDADGARLHA
jgi:hypothetical protein